MKKEKSKQAAKPQKAPTTKEIEKLEPCKIAPDPEHFRLTDKDEPCDDSRGGNI